MSKVVEFIFPKPFLVRLTDFIENPNDLYNFSIACKRHMLVCYTYLCRLKDNEDFYASLPGQAYLYYQCIKKKEGVKIRLDTFYMCHYALCINNVKILKLYWNRSLVDRQCLILYKEAILRSDEKMKCLKFLMKRKTSFQELFYKNRRDFIDICIKKPHVFQLLFKAYWIEVDDIYIMIKKGQMNEATNTGCLVINNLISCIGEKEQFKFFDYPDFNGYHPFTYKYSHIESLCKIDKLLVYMKPVLESLLMSTNEPEAIAKLTQIKNKYF